MQVQEEELDGVTDSQLLLARFFWKDEEDGEAVQFPQPAKLRGCPEQGLGQPEELGEALDGLRWGQKTKVADGGRLRCET